MAIAGFIVEIVAATMLLLFAVRLVRTGVERRFGPVFVQVLKQGRNVFYAAATGMGLAVVIQSSAAVGLLLTGFAAAGLVPFGMALAGFLGADLGSALVIQILSFDLGWLQPFLLAAGGWLYLKSERSNWRLAGRIVLGIAFILIALQFLRDAVDPIRQSAFLPAVAGYLAQDYLTAFLAGAALAFVMHSSVAAILICVTFVQVGALPFSAGLSLVLGANLGSALIPVWLTRDMAARPRRIPLANLVLRGAAAVALLVGLNRAELSPALQVAGPGQSLVLVHIAFNLLLVLGGLCLVGVLERPMAALLPDPEREGSQPGHLAEPQSPLDDAAGAPGGRALSSLRQELLQMVTRIERMLRSVPDMYARDDMQEAEALGEAERRVNGQLADIRRFVARIPRAEASRRQIKTARGLLEYAIRLEAAGDIVAERIARLARLKHDEGARFSRPGWKEIAALHAAVLKSFPLARHILLDDDDLESARRLVLEKADVKRMERASRKAHLKRLETGAADSFGSSDLHLETLRALRDLHGHVVSVAYPMLYRSGQILETRLVTEPQTGAAG